MEALGARAPFRDPVAVAAVPAVVSIQINGLAALVIPELGALGVNGDLPVGPPEIAIFTEGFNTMETPEELRERPFNSMAIL